MPEELPRLVLLVPEDQTAITELFAERDPFTLLPGKGGRVTLSLGKGQMLAFRLTGERNEKAMKIMRSYVGQPNIVITGAATFSGLLPAQAFDALKVMSDASTT